MDNCDIFFNEIQSDNTGDEGVERQECTCLCP